MHKIIKYISKFYNDTPKHVQLFVLFISKLLAKYWNVKIFTTTFIHFSRNIPQVCDGKKKSINKPIVYNDCINIAIKITAICFTNVLYSRISMLLFVNLLPNQSCAVNTHSLIRIYIHTHSIGLFLLCV